MIVNRGPDPGPFPKHGQYRPHLRPIFRSRCAYCLTPDCWMGGLEGMTVDHFQPVSRFPHLLLDWKNLYYSCSVCNEHYKRDHPTEEEETKGCRFVDSCAEDPDDHFRMVRDRKTRLLCKVKAMTDSGRYTLLILRFNERPFLRDFWMELEQRERNAIADLQEVNRNINDTRAIMRRGEDSSEIQQLLERALAQRTKIRVRLAEVRSWRPFPVE
jgi:uncharacterized protein (TIGR02646 family)